MAAPQPAAARRSARVAVVGAGAAGLAAARELREEGHCVTVFEAGNAVGGTWRYDAAAGSHSSMYASLRTNLPRELMAYSDLPFAPSAPLAGDARRYCGHAEVLAYLEQFAAVHDLAPLIRFGHCVERAAPLPGGAAGLGPQWEVTASGVGAQHTATFDALCVANGHYSVPRTPPVAGLADFPGAVSHTHDYRTPTPWSGQRVLVVGGAASGDDISRDVLPVAAAVFLSAASFQTDGPLAGGAVQKRPMLVKLHPDGAAEFADGTREVVDAVLFATGYHFCFPFLRDANVVTAEDNCVSPLYEHVFPPHAPSLSFIGLPWKVVPFPMFELQAKWVARVLSSAVSLPPRAAMEHAVAEAAARLAPRGAALPRHAHAMTLEQQFDYNDRVAAAAGAPPLPRWRREMYAANSRNKRAQPDRYRDVWDPADECLPAAAATV